VATLPPSADGLLRASGKNIYIEPDPEGMTYLLNKYAHNVEFIPFGFNVEVPENVVLALQYLDRFGQASNDELDEIVATGTTRIHEFVKNLGVDLKLALDDFPEEIVRGDFRLSLRKFPALTLCLDDRKFVCFKAEDIETCFLRNVLDGEASEEELEMLWGVSLLSERSQSRYMRLLSNGKLKMDGFAKALLRAASSSKDEVVWKGIAKWLRRNGYEGYAGQIIVKKTLM